MSDILEEEIFFNSETGEYETRLIDKTTKKEFKEQQKELNKNLEDLIHFPYKDDTESKRVLRDVIRDIDYDDVALGLDNLPESERKLYADYVDRKKYANEKFNNRSKSGRPTKIISEKSIRYSMENSTTLREAAIFLSVPRPRWDKYAKLYIDKETGLNLFQLHQLKCWGDIDLTIDKRRKILLENRNSIKDRLYKRLIDDETGEYVLKANRRPINNRAKKIRLYDVLNGLYPNYDPIKLKRMLFKSGWFERKCIKCGFNSTRLSDDNGPFVLNYKDGDYHNHIRSNLEILCFNCFFQYSPLAKNTRYYKF